MPFPCELLQLAAASNHLLSLAVQDLNSMRQDLATYASDLKTEQDHAVRVMLPMLCSMSPCCPIHLAWNTLSASC